MCEYLLCLSALLTIELTHFSLPHCNISATEYNVIKNNNYTAVAGCFILNSLETSLTYVV
jgi:hypothetical protein